jgi:hypothetical protein
MCNCVDIDPQKLGWQIPEAGLMTGVRLQMRAWIVSVGPCVTQPSQPHTVSQAYGPKQTTGRSSLKRE